MSLPIFSVVALLLAFVGCPSPVLGRKGAPDVSLYSATDPVDQLNIDNYGSFITGKTHATLVEYYSATCSHCIRFAPTYVRFAQDVILWKSVLRVAAINCAAQKNIDVCSNSKVLSFPAFKYYGPGSNNDTFGEFLDYELRTETGIREATLVQLERTSRNSSTSPRSWPALTPIQAETKSELMNRLPFNGNIPVVVIIESKESFVGREVILDLSTYTSRVIIVRVVDPYGTLTKELAPEDTILPILARVRNNGEFDLLKSSSGSNNALTFERKLFVERIKADYLKNSWADPVNKVSSTPRPVDQSSGEQLEDVQVHLVDLYNAIRYSLYHELRLHKELNATQLDVLFRYTSVISQYFPFDGENPRRFVKRMALWFEGRNATDDKSIKAIMYAGSEGYLPGSQPYVGCNGSRPNLRGYPCALWLLFHTLTVSEYTKPETDPSKIKDYHSVLFAMRDYVKYFFTCRECVQHFGVMAANLTNELRHPNSSVLWLWKAHNKVNARLKGDNATEDPAHPKVQFPTKGMCPECYKGKSVDAGEIKWDETRVIKFLSNQYHKTNIVRNHSWGPTLSPLLRLIVLVLCFHSLFK